MPPNATISKIRFIVNPISGHGKTREIKQYIEKYLDQKLFTYEIIFTTCKGDATRLSKEAVQMGFDLVVAVGGDGTVHEVGKALIGTTVPLGIIPAGSGNGLARHCKIPCDFKKAILLLNKLTFQNIDTVQIDGDHFLNIAGIGFDANIAWKFGKQGKRGFFTYLKLVIQDFIFYKNQEYELVIDGKKIKRHLFFISLANSSQYGCNVRISPMASITDGLLDVVLIRPFPLWYIPMAFFHLLRSTAHRSNQVEIFSAKEVVLLGGPFNAHLDGEPVIFKKDVVVTMLPKSLRLLCK